MKPNLINKLVKKFHRQKRVDFWRLKHHSDISAVTNVWAIFGHNREKKCLVQYHRAEHIPKQVGQKHPFKAFTDKK